jgi:hypothetical protein
VGTLTTGTDWDVRCLQLCRPTRSEILYKQIVGRSLRIADGKPDALILDHSDTTQTLGFVTDIEYDWLDSRNKPLAQAERKKAMPKECSKCGALITKKAAECYNCGTPFRVISDIVENDGELVEVTGGVGRSGKRIYTVADQRDWFRQLKRHQLNRVVRGGRALSDGWVSVCFKEKFGNWPPRKWNDMLQPTDFVGTEVAAFIKKKAKEYVRKLAGTGVAR